MDQYTTCTECGAELYENTGGVWLDTEYDSAECIDENGNPIAGQKHLPDLCSDGTPEHNWIGPEFGEQICPECGSTQIVVQAQKAGAVQAGGAVPNNPYAPSNPAIIEKFKQLQEEREKEMEDRKQRTYRDSLGDDFFKGMKFEGGVDPDKGQCHVCPINFGDDADAKELLDYHLQQVHLIGVPDDDDDEDATV